MRNMNQLAKSLSYFMQFFNGTKHIKFDTKYKIFDVVSVKINSDKSYVSI